MALYGTPCHPLYMDLPSINLPAGDRSPTRGVVTMAPMPAHLKRRFCPRQVTRLLESPRRQRSTRARGVAADEAHRAASEAEFRWYRFGVLGVPITTKTSSTTRTMLLAGYLKILYIRPCNRYLQQLWRGSQMDRQPKACTCWVVRPSCQALHTITRQQSGAPFWSLLLTKSGFGFAK